MNFSDYAAAKRDGYKKLGWKVGDIDLDSDSVSFITVDVNGVSRRHYFSASEIKVELVDVPVQEPVTVVELPVEVIVDPVVVDSVVKETTKKTKTKRTKKGE